MANERFEKKPENQEDSEYHFSDEEANYEVDPTVTATKTPGASGSIISRLSQSRSRLIISITVFILLLVMVYKFLSPSSEAPNTEFNSQETSRAVKIKNLFSHHTNPAVQPKVTTPAQMVQSAPVVMHNPNMPTNMAPNMMPSPNVSVVASAQPAQPSVSEVALANQQKNIVDRMAVLEQQNTDMMNLLETQYAQKLTDYETQNNQLRAQVQELNSRLGNIEVAFHELTKIMRGMRERESMQPRPSVTSSEAAVSSQSSMNNQQRVNYSVQAVIPGRAWLKSDAGETVTVAEGDIIKDFGKVVKIDPYDGIVSVDTGKRVLSLTYGAGGDT